MADDNPVIETILQRRSCRSYDGGGPDEEELELLIDCLRRAPSAGNRQPWRFHVVENDELRGELRRAGGQKMIEKAPVVFVICALPDRSAKAYEERGRELYCIQDTACAGMSLLLAADALGYGACWVGAFDEAAVARALELPTGERPVALIPVGSGKPGILGLKTPRRGAGKTVRRWR
jgi:nitroreductase